MPGYVGHFAVHRRSRLGVVAFANSYGLSGTTIQDVALEALTAAVDAEPDLPQPWRPATVPAGELSGRWWWMGREYEVSTDGDELTMTAPHHRSVFAREAPDRWRGVEGDDEGEVLTIVRGEDEAVAALDIATFVFTRDPFHLA
jgi:hypothetical protein